MWIIVTPDEIAGQKESLSRSLVHQINTEVNPLQFGPV